MKKFRYLVAAIDKWGGITKHEVRAISEQEAEDIFNFMHAAESLKIAEIKYLGL